MIGTATRPTVSAVIVNYNGGELLTRSVAGVLSSPMPIEVFVVDNGSKDDSLELLRTEHGNDKRLIVIENDRNLGFTRANNIALKRAKGDFMLLLNPDCLVEHEAIGRVLATMERFPEAGMAGCLIRNEDGSEQAGCRRSIPTPWRTLVRVFHLDKVFPNHRRFRNFVLTQDPLPNGPVFLEAISGAFMLVRREAVKQVGLLDEGYFLHCDDLDWCMRFQQTGWRILFVPDVAVTHFQGTCSVGRPIFVAWHKHKGMIRFYRKFFRHQYPAPLMALVMGAVWGRFALVVLHESAKVAIARVRGPVRQPERQKPKAATIVLPRLGDRRSASVAPQYNGPERRMTSYKSSQSARIQ